MNKACDLIALAIESYRSGELDAAAKFFATALGSDDLDSFVDHITKSVPRTALQGPVPASENTLNPSLASASADDLSEIVDRVEARFRAECSLLDDDESETEVRASDEDEEDIDDDDLDDGELDYDDEDELEDDVELEEDYEVEASGSKRKIVATVGPVRLKL